MRTIAVLCGLLNLALVGLVSFVIVAIALAPWENVDDHEADDWLVVVGPALSAPPLAILVGVAAGLPRLATWAYVAQTCVAIPSLVAALGSADGRFIALVVGVQAAAGLAVLISRAERRVPSGAASASALAARRRRIR